MDDEVRRLLIDELEKQRTILAARSSPERERRALHSLKGSFGMTNQRDISESFARLERRLIAGDADAVVDSLQLIDTAIVALREHRAIPTQVWPEPPRDISVGSRDPSLVVGYLDAVRDRLGRIDASLAVATPDDDTWLATYREIHNIKGAALAVGDELMAWFCHGLEEHLRSARDARHTPRRLLDEVVQYRSLMSEILESPEHALATLRLLTGAARPSVRPPIETPLPLPPKRPSLDYEPASESRPLADDSVRVHTATLERLFERAAQLGQVRGPLSGNVSTLERSALRAGEIQRSVREALRMIGPPRPWGAPAAAIERLNQGAIAISALAATLDRVASQLSTAAMRVGREGTAIQASVTAMRTTQATRLFEPIASTIANQARREGKEVTVTITGGETPIDRRLADALVDPITQLARNSIAHGLESPDLRRRKGKPRQGSIELKAELRSGMLILEVSDDGPGVDTNAVRQRAIELHTMDPELAAGLSERTVLSLLFVPGFTTRTSADMLSGRGVGLDLTLAAVHRVGGTMQLSSQADAGMNATIVVPTEGVLVKVLWFELLGATFALPLVQTGRVARLRDVPDAHSLTDVLPRPVIPEPADTRPPKSAGDVHGEALAIEVVHPRDPSIPSAYFKVDAIGAVEDVVLRAVAPIVRLSSPFIAAIAWGDQLRFCLDADQLLARVSESHR